MKHVKDDMGGSLDMDLALEWVMEAYEAEMLGIETRVIVGFQVGCWQRGGPRV